MSCQILMSAMVLFCLLTLANLFVLEGDPQAVSRIDRPTLPQSAPLQPSKPKGMSSAVANYFLLKKKRKERRECRIYRSKLFKARNHFFGHLTQKADYLENSRHLAHYMVVNDLFDMMDFDKDESVTKKEFEMFLKLYHVTNPDNQS